MSVKGEEYEVGDEEFKSLTRDDARARMLRKVMQELADGKQGDPVAEMARSVMAGRAGVLEALNELPRTEEAEGRLVAFQERWDSMSETQRFEAEKQAREFLRQQQEEIDEERGPGPNVQQSARHSGRGWSLY